MTLFKMCARESILGRCASPCYGGLRGEGHHLRQPHSHQLLPKPSVEPGGSVSQSKPALDG